jgi:hypothetical protein
MAPEVCLPGHGSPFGDVSNLIRGRINRHLLRLGDVQKAVARGSSTGFEIATRIPWVQRSKQFMDLTDLHRLLALGETLAYLEYLEAQAIINRRGTSPIRWGNELSKRE